MYSMMYFAVLFLAKVLDNALSTTKTILIQRSRWLLAGIAVVLSDFIYFWLTKRIVAAESDLAILIVALAGGVGCALACAVSEKISKDRTYVNVIMSDNLEAMQDFRDFLAKHHITNVAADTYIRDFLGHVDISTTEVYARIDAEMKRKVFEEKVPNFTPNTTMPWEEDKDLLQWLTQFGKKSF